MKKSLIMVIIIQLAIFSLFTGCEEGLNAGNDSGSSSEGTGFSFSDMYSKFSKLQEEVDRVRQENEELKAVIEALTGDSLDTSNSLTTRISDLESSVATLEGMNSTFAGVTRLTD
ncbi:MAG: hypothetical protein GY754_11985, partial [bacterium]|nr:hypothetical protein [bacterium]